MKILLKSAKIYDPESPHHLRNKDIYIENGIILKIADSVSRDVDKVISSPHLSISPGWVDIGALCGEPGHEQREYMTTLAAAARRGGYTAVALFPNTVPPIQSKSSVKYVLDQAATTGFRFLPLAALSQDLAGKEMNELLDLKNAGVVGFSDGLNSIKHTGLMLKLLQYLSQLDSVLIHYPSDTVLTADGQMHEGVVSTSLGLKGLPAMAETIIVDRDLKLREYTDGNICFYGISAKESIEKIIEAKAKTDKILVVIPFMNLIYDESALSDFDANFKLIPPLRGETDKNALREALIAGQIDAISSNHVPLDTEDKKLEFPYAKSGASGIEVCYSVLQHHMSDAIDQARIVYCLANGPRKVLGLEKAAIVEGGKADLTVFDPNEEFVFDHSLSLGVNNPHLGQKLKGKVLATIVNNNLFENHL